MESEAVTCTDVVHWWGDVSKSVRIHKEYDFDVFLDGFEGVLAEFSWFWSKIAIISRCQLFQNVFMYKIV